MGDGRGRNGGSGVHLARSPGQRRCHAARPGGDLRSRLPPRRLGFSAPRPRSAAGCVHSRNRARPDAAGPRRPAAQRPTEARRVTAPDRLRTRDVGAARDDRTRRVHRFHRAPRRRKRRREGAGRSADSRVEPPEKRPFRGDQLCRPRRNPVGGRAVRHRGPNRHRRTRATREVRVRRRRHPVSRRGVGPVDVGSGKTAPRDSGSRHRARGRQRSS